MKVYEEVIDFIASGPSANAVADFQASAVASARVSWLIEREKAGLLPAEEKQELDRYMELEHIMRLSKAGARQHLLHEQSRQ